MSAPSMTFEEWRATRKDYDALPEDEAGVWAGGPGSVYTAGFILATGAMNFTVHLPTDSRDFSTLAEAEAFLWAEWCGPEINGEPT